MEGLEPQRNDQLFEKIIIHEDEDVIVIRKPSGLQVHPDRKNRLGTLVNFLIYRNPELIGVGESVERPGIVHRLDRDTSGLMLITKNNDAFFYYKEQFKLRTVRKTYQALVHGLIKKEEGVIDAPIGIAPKNTVMRTTTPYARDKKDAETFFTVKERYCERISANKQFCYTLVETFPKTGRTHQIRVHLRSIGHPIAGDTLYKFKRQRMPRELSRLFLVSKKLEYNDRKGTSQSFEVPLEEDLEQVLSLLRKHNSLAE